ncbi:gamma-glutamyltransferase [Portibacter marinus]|uniref:gamma-glutamyltransferase n=1 Tax=Portibacter marinus TaxID=2898660 RepID=UPI001F4640D5|nr:gamma-glutamyltransferase [Portibacter marinus]
MKTVTLQILFLVTLLCSCSTKVEKPLLFGEVASAHPLATKAGLEILERGGNAFDAAIAVAATLNVVEPMMSGIGGYGTTLIYDAEKKKVRYLNSSGRFPEATNSDLMRAPTSSHMENRIGPKAISTPGNLNAWAALHKAYGSLEWSELFDAAIKHAEEGYLISANTARFIEYSFSAFNDYPKSFYSKNGEPLKEGDRLIQKDLAQTFRTIAKEGADPFYRGEIAEKIDQKMKDIGSFLRKKDLELNEAEWWEPLSYNYRGYEVYTASLPANSFPTLFNLGLMEQFPRDSLNHNSTDYLHRFAEMTKESYRARLAYSFDPDVREAPIDSILSKEVLNAFVSSIDKDRATEFEPPFSPNSVNTTHFVVADRSGNIVSATQTLGNVFGSRIMVEGTGVWLNNSMAYSTFEPKGNPMDAFPSRHKLSGDSPVIIMKDGNPYAAMGSPGGHTITQNVPQIIFNLLDFDMSMQDAIDAPKITFVEPNTIRVDSELDATTIKALEEKGHQMVKGSIGNATGIKLMYDEQGVLKSYDVGIDRRGEGRNAIIDH